MVTELAEIGLRIKGLARGVRRHASRTWRAELEVPVWRPYEEWEETGADVPISAIYHMAHHFGVEFTEILTGTAGQAATPTRSAQRGEGREVDRYPGYHFEDLAWRFTGKIMQPLLVGARPAPTSRRSSSTHTGQEFNLRHRGLAWS